MYFLFFYIYMYFLNASILLFICVRTTSFSLYISLCSILFTLQWKGLLTTTQIIHIQSTKTELSIYKLRIPPPLQISWAEHCIPRKSRDINTYMYMKIYLEYVWRIITSGMHNWYSQSSTPVYEGACKLNYYSQYSL